MDTSIEIPLKQIHKCGKSIHCDYYMCDYEECDMINECEKINLGINEIPENLIDLDKVLPFIFNDLTFDINYKVEHPTIFKIRNLDQCITLRRILEYIYEFVDKSGEHDVMFIEQLFYNPLTEKLEISWGS